MKTRRILKIAKWWLAPVAVLVLLVWAGIGGAVPALDEQLIEAATSGDLALVKTLLSKSADVNAKDRCGRTALMRAATEGHTDIVELLLKKGADVHTKDEDGRTALMCAARGMYANVMKLLLESGADFNAKDRHGETAFTLAIQFLDYDLMTQMEKCCALEPAEMGGLGFVFLDHSGCPPDGMQPPWVRERERAEVMKLLQTLQTQGIGGALIIAATQRDKKKVQQLLAAGANVLAKAPNGVTALMMAVEWGDADVAALLLTKGAEVNAQDNYGRTALTRAVALDQTDVVKLLVDKGADINAVDKYGWTPVMFATHGSQYSLRYLLAKGADPNMRAITGRTALMEAAQLANFDEVKQLLDRGADVNARTQDGQTALMLAVSIGLPRSGLAAKVVKLLLEQGADANTKDGSGKTVLQRVPKMKGAEEIMRLLKAYGAKE